MATLTSSYSSKDTRRPRSHHCVFDDRAHIPKSRSIGSLPLSRAQRTPMTMTPTSPLSPSRLPQTDCMSYFPPFELMGSEEEAAEAESSQPGEQIPKHRKGTSIGSIAGIISLLSPNTPLPPKVNKRTTSDGDVIQALTQRVTTPGNKRRVLEPMSVGNEVGQSVRDSNKVGGTIIRRTHSASKPGPSRRPKPHLVVPLPLPIWRIPLPSPPVASLSTDIPLEAFFNPVENPLSTSRQSSPSKRANLLHPEGYFDPNDLSPTVSCSGSLSLSSAASSRPTSPRSPRQDEGDDDDDMDVWSDVDTVKVRRYHASSESLRSTYSRRNSTGSQYSYCSMRRKGSLGVRPKLERTDSQASHDSKETIRPHQRD
jgi:hypothetical protein